MDIISHGVWGSIGFGRKSRKSFWIAFFFGVAPDLFSFGIFTASTWLGLVSGPDWSAGPPDSNLIPQYVHALYDITHSLIVFLAAFILVWIVRKKPLYELGAWGLHILLDIPTHSARFFPTPFLWPISDFHIDGISWGNPLIFIPNVTLLAGFSFYFFFLKRRRKGRK